MPTTTHSQRVRRTPLSQPAAIGEHAWRSVDEQAAARHRRLCDDHPLRSDILVAEALGDIIGLVADAPCATPVNGDNTQLHAVYLEVRGSGTEHRA